MSAREELFRRVAGAFVDEDRANKLIDAVIAERDAQIVAWLLKKSHEYGVSNRENRAKAEAVWRMADKLSRGAVRPTLPPVPRQRQQEDPHDGPLHHDYVEPRELPFIPGQTTGRCPNGHTFENCTCGGAA